MLAVPRTQRLPSSGRSSLPDSRNDFQTPLGAAYTGQDRLRAALADRYRIEREIGAGGMATVYLAQDLKHDRKVALKVLKPELAAVIGGERFLVEIKTTANLQHPHILALFDSGTVDGSVFYAMPFVEGESLRDRLARETQLPIDDALRIATEVADALQYAHARGVIHRDIKPENILLQGGHALVADFGIALAASTTSGGRMTETGMSLGTPTYMSPEQAMGERAIDARADIYALGCVLYEMLVGEAPFTGPTAQAIVARVLTGTAEAPAMRRSTVPANVNAAVLTALQKLPADRFATAAAFADAIKDRGYATVSSPATSGSAGTASSWNRVAVAGWTLAAAAVITAGWTIVKRPALAAKPVWRMALDLPDSVRLAPGELRLAVSPDGSQIAVAGTIPHPTGVSRKESQVIWVRRRDQLDLTRVAQTEGGIGPFFSPDGHHLLTRSEDGLKVVDLDAGGPPMTVADPAKPDAAATFGPDGLVYSGGSSGLVAINVTTGAQHSVSTVDHAAHEYQHIAPGILPNGRGALFTVTRLPVSNNSIYDVAVVDFRTGRHRVLTRGVLARYLDGFLLVVRADGVLAAAPFDQDKLVQTGPEVPIISGIRAGAFGLVDVAIGGDGTLAYVSGEGGDDPALLVWVSRNGQSTMLDSTWRADFDGIALSPDGTRIAASIVEGSRSNVWVEQLSDRTRSKLTLDNWRSHRPFWFPDGKTVGYLSEERSPLSLLARRADGTGTAERLTHESRDIADGLVSPDGKWLVYRTSSTTPGHADILAQRIGDTVGTPLLATQADERHPTISPDGRWLAYRSNESGKPEVYVRPFPNVGDGKWPVSTSGGSDPVWSHSGKELFYINAADEMVAATIATQSTFAVGSQKVLFKLPTAIRPSVSSARYAVSRDDQKFLMIRSVADATGNAKREQIILVTNFVEEIKAKIGVKK